MQGYIRASCKYIRQTLSPTLHVAIGLGALRSVACCTQLKHSRPLQWKTADGASSNGPQPPTPSHWLTGPAQPRLQLWSCRNAHDDCVVCSARSGGLRHSPRPRDGCPSCHGSMWPLPRRVLAECMGCRCGADNRHDVCMPRCLCGIWRHGLYFAAVQQARRDSDAHGAIRRCHAPTDVSHEPCLSIREFRSDIRAWRLCFFGPVLAVTLQYCRITLSCRCF